MKMKASLAAVEQIIGYTFRNKKLLEEALTHTSDPKVVSYECLEFVGDAVLGLAISNHLFLAYTFVDPGQLSFVLPMSAPRNSLVPPFVMVSIAMSVTTRFRLLIRLESLLMRFSERMIVLLCCMVDRLKL
ncbi:ribonuclease 3-like protein 2-like, partial [Trifolium medium]|nr:ribonuclease 3-like protein 2-like [Trifolium medium]